MPTTRELFEVQRERVMSMLRAREPELMRELESLDLALRNLGQEAAAPDEFTGHTHAWKAVVAYLEKIKRTEDETVLARVIVEGGWLRNNQHAFRNVKNSIGYQLRHSEQHKVIKRFPSGRIGLYSWPLDYDRAAR